ncbi:MAG: molecular chaperone [Acidiferrobacterales bacterium]
MMNEQVIPADKISKADDAMEVVADEAIRANTYSLLATLLANPPSSDVLHLLKQIEVPQDNGGSGMAAVWQTLRLAGERATVAALEDEYHDLFIGLGRGELVPYGSWYMSGFLMDRPLTVLRQDLAALGFERQEDVHEPEDHVAALCETMSLIIDSRDEIPFDTQRKFYGDHVVPWVGRFFSDLQEAKSARFYRAVGQFGEQFIEIEKQYLNMLT